MNLGIGIPTLVANYVRDDIEVEFQSENGVLGMGPFPFKGKEDEDTVPYTHLRAHETLEHLVGRLLLKKKKKQMTT